MANRGIVRLDKVRSVYSGHLESLKHETLDIDNGAVVMVGEHYDGEREVRKAVLPTAATISNEPVVLVAAPEIVYEQYRTKDNALGNFYNEKGQPFRAYHLEKADIFSVSTNMIDGDIEEGKFVVAQDDSFKLKSVDTTTNEKFIGKIIAVETIGTTTVVGAQGNVGRITELAVIEVVQN